MVIVSQLGLRASWVLDVLKPRLWIKKHKSDHITQAAEVLVEEANVGLRERHHLVYKQRSS